MKENFGRSMIEMLGVLAIIGVLSIGGLTAYRQAMDSYRANQLLNFISQVVWTYRELCVDADSCPIKQEGVANYANVNRSIVCERFQNAPDICGGIGVYEYIKASRFGGNSQWRTEWSNADKDIGRVSFRGLPEGVCLNLLGRLEQLQHLGIKEVAMNSTSFEISRITEGDRVHLQNGCENISINLNSYLSLRFERDF